MVLLRGRRGSLVEALLSVRRKALEALVKRIGKTPAVRLSPTTDDLICKRHVSFWNTAARSQFCRRGKCR